MSAAIETGTVVAEAGGCQVILTGMGFYAGCTRCPWASGNEHAKFRARMAAEAHKCERENASGCAACGRPVERVDVPLPAYAAPVPWWHHDSEASARACPGRGPVRPALVRAGTTTSQNTQEMYRQSVRNPVH